MAKGLVSGALAGVVVSVLGLGAVSELVPPPGRRGPAPQVTPPAQKPVPKPAEARNETGTESGTANGSAALPSATASTAAAPQAEAEATSAPDSTAGTVETAGTEPAAAPEEAPTAETAAATSTAPETRQMPEHLPRIAREGETAGSGGDASGIVAPPVPETGLPGPSGETAPAATGTAPNPQVAQSDMTPRTLPAPGDSGQPAPTTAPAPLPGSSANLPAQPSAPDNGEESPKFVTAPGTTSGAPSGVNVASAAPDAPSPASADMPPVAPRTDATAPGTTPAGASGLNAARPALPAPAGTDGLPSPEAAAESQPRILKIGRDAGVAGAAPASGAEEGAAPLPGAVSGPPSISGAPKPGFGNGIAGVKVGRLPTITDKTAQDGAGNAGGEKVASAPSAVVPSPGKRIVLAPRAGSEAGSEAGTGAGTGSKTIAAPAAPQPAVARYASSFDDPKGKPVIAILMIDTGGDVDRAALAKLPLHITFVVDPTKPGAAEAARTYRAAGREVLILGSGIPADAGVKEVATIFEGYKAEIPEAVGVLDPAEGGWEADRPLSQTVVAEIHDRGLGLLTYGRGLDSAAQIAQAEGVPSAQVYRRLDADDENPEKIARYLDRAAFKAAQDGRVVVIGHTRPDTVTGLTAWAGDVRAHTLAIGPVTAALKP